MWHIFMVKLYLMIWIVFKEYQLNVILRRNDIPFSSRRSLRLSWYIVNLQSENVFFCVSFFITKNKKIFLNPIRMTLERTRVSFDTKTWSCLFKNVTNSIIFGALFMIFSNAILLPQGCSAGLFVADFDFYSLE